MMMVIIMRLNSIRDIGPTRESLLNAAGIHTVKDLVRTLPKRYIKRTLVTVEKLHEIEYNHIAGTVDSTPSVFFIRKNLSRMTFKMKIESGRYTVSVFNQHYLKRVLHKGTAVVIQAKKNNRGSSLTASKVFLEKNFVQGYEPIYNIPNINDATFHKLVINAFEVIGGHFEDPLPTRLIQNHGLPDYTTTVKIAHHPQNDEQYDIIQKRLKYQELFYFHMRMRLAKHQRKESIRRTPFDEQEIATFLTGLPYEPTTAQKQAIREILDDLQRDTLMYRMLQGDTGSGKTLVAITAALAVMDRGGQVAFMAPTDILARQHYQNTLALLEKTPYKIALLTQSVVKEKQKQILKQLEDGEIDLVVGTHKLYAQTVIYHDLRFVIADEQHRFGVNQRMMLRKKGDLVDTLYLSATPIPRTLAHTIYGDMDQSTLDEKPQNVSPVQTEIFPINQTQSLRHTISETLERDEQIFVVSPNIEATDTIPYGAKKLHSIYKKFFANRTVALLHGQISRDQQDDMLRRFRDKKIDILVATTIIEVGVDFPEATLMIIYHADRFGFAQLHQLRGRVGRGAKPGRCIMVFKPSEEAQTRMEILKETNDGFVLSEHDLKTRGHGDLIGTLQSGYLPFEFVDFEKDIALVRQAKKDVEDYFKAVFIDEEKSYDLLRRQLFEPLED